MTRDKAMEIMKDEEMKHFNWYDDHDIKPNEVGIRERANKWNVYTSDERANPISEKEFQSESEALENFIKRLRAINKFNNNYK
ncbi:hypothetical protein QFZ81_000166 [Paenibacillus sp. V4I9]|uniref:hypothetical protein n=1 Tax=Paenibacillus sp. V4I9 TaxID=3042308 RepID=UPI0027840F23|nr:hypothetical protein [Paenibacillus sp. V4I9]MDQ0885078.1 hypothetical protein [Paenibacillus sp. V4I9]